MADHPAPGVHAPTLPVMGDGRPASPVFSGEPLIKIDYVQTSPDSCHGAAIKSVNIVFNTLDVVGESIDMT